MVDRSPVGIDVELISPADNNIARTFLSDKEPGYIVDDGPEIEKAGRFFDIWTLKESYVKALGCGLSKDLNAFTVEMSGVTPKVIDPISSSHVFLRQYVLDQEHRLSVCTFADELPALLIH